MHWDCDKGCLRATLRCIILFLALACSAGQFDASFSPTSAELGENTTLAFTVRLPGRKEHVSNDERPTILCNVRGFIANTIMTMPDAEVAVFTCNLPAISEAGPADVFLSTDGGRTWWKAQDQLLIIPETFGVAPSPSANPVQIASQFSSEAGLNGSLAPALEVWLEKAIESLLDGQDLASVYPPASLLANLSGTQDTLGPFIAPAIQPKQTLQKGGCILSAVRSSTKNGTNLLINLDLKASDSTATEFWCQFEGEAEQSVVPADLFSSHGVLSLSCLTTNTSTPSWVIIRQKRDPQYGVVLPVDWSNSVWLPTARGGNDETATGTCLIPLTVQAIDEQIRLLQRNALHTFGRELVVQGLPAAVTVHSLISFTIRSSSANTKQFEGQWQSWVNVSVQARQNPTVQMTTYANTIQVSFQTTGLQALDQITVSILFNGSDITTYPRIVTVLDYILPAAIWQIIAPFQNNQTWEVGQLVEVAVVPMQPVLSQDFSGQCSALQAELVPQTDAPQETEVQRLSIVEMQPPQCVILVNSTRSGRFLLKVTSNGQSIDSFLDPSAASDLQSASPDFSGTRRALLSDSIKSSTSNESQLGGMANIMGATRSHMVEIEISPGAIYSSTLSQLSPTGLNLTAGKSVAIALHAEDVYGNGIADQEVQLALNGSTGSTVPCKAVKAGLKLTVNVNNHVRKEEN